MGLFADDDDDVLTLPVSEREEFSKAWNEQ